MSLLQGFISQQLLDLLLCDIYRSVNSWNYFCTRQKSNETNHQMDNWLTFFFFLVIVSWDNERPFVQAVQHVDHPESTICLNEPCVSSWSIRYVHDIRLEASLASTAFSEAKLTLMLAPNSENTGMLCKVYIQIKCSNFRSKCINMLKLRNCVFSMKMLFIFYGAINIFYSRF